MPRNMSFMLTTQQVIDEIKLETRRLGWWNVKIGEMLNAVKQCQGLKKGEHIIRLKLIVVVEAEPEPLNAITKQGCILEGFPHLEPAEFVEFFMKHNRCAADERVNRIRFKYVRQY